MSIHTKEAGDFVEQEDNLRRKLVERIVTSAAFTKSERLTSFLKCVCELSEQNRAEEINEQYIGTTVFGRNPDYDPAVDSIVRSHASRLRHRLHQYFAEEGAGEELVLTIPKGAYVPVFSRTATERTPDLPLYEKPVMAVDRIVPLATTMPAAVISSAEQNVTERGHTSRGWMAALLAVALTLAAVAGAMVERQHGWSSPKRTESNRLLWGQLFTAEQKTVVVLADSGLVILQGLTKRRVGLDAYLSGDYLKDLQTPDVPVKLAANLATRRYTSIVDLMIQNRIFRLPGAELDRTQFRYSRDLRPGEMKQGNLVLLGTYESTPWVQLFEPSMNFYFENDLAGGVFSIVNRHPRAGEQARYDCVSTDPDHTVYGVVAYRPSLSGSGKVLILEGQSMAGTETAADFVFDDGYLVPFLHTIQRADGTLPYFELLLRSRSMSAEASRLEMVAMRVEDEKR